MFKSVMVVIPKKEEIRDKYIAILYKKKKKRGKTAKGKTKVSIKSLVLRGKKRKSFCFTLN